MSVTSETNDAAIERKGARTRDNAGHGVSLQRHATHNLQLDREQLDNPRGYVGSSVRSPVRSPAYLSGECSARRACHHDRSQPHHQCPHPLLNHRRLTFAFEVCTLRR